MFHTLGTYAHWNDPYDIFFPSSYWSGLPLQYICQANLSPANCFCLLLENESFQYFKKLCSTIIFGFMFFAYFYLEIFMTQPTVNTTFNAAIQAWEASSPGTIERLRREWHFAPKRDWDGIQRPRSGGRSQARRIHENEKQVFLLQLNAEDGVHVLTGQEVLQ